MHRTQSYYIEKCDHLPVSLKSCTFVNKLPGITLPDTICKPGNFHNCIIAWKSYFINKKKKLESFDALMVTQTPLKEKDTPSYDTSVMYSCTNSGFDCQCNTDRCNGTSAFCDKVTCDFTSLCFCEVIKVKNEYAIIKLDRKIWSPTIVSLRECIFRKKAPPIIFRKLLSVLRDPMDDEPVEPDQASKTKKRMLTFGSANTSVWFQQPVFTFNKQGTLILRKDGLETIIAVPSNRKLATIPYEMTLHKGELSFIYITPDGGADY